MNELGVRQRSLTLPADETEPDGSGGSLACWTLPATDGPSPQRTPNRLRHRLNRIVNADLRPSFGR